MSPLLRAIPSTLGDETPTAYTVEEIRPGVFVYVYVPLSRLSAPPEPRPDDPADDA